MLRVDEKFPDFKIAGYFNGEVKDFKLSDYHGKWLVLFTYPADFTFVCPTEVKGFNNEHHDFKKLNAEVLGLSVDSPESHKEWIKQEWHELNYPLLSDEKATHIKAWNVDTKDEKGKIVALRATLIISPDGVLKHYTVSNNDVGRSVDETLRVLEAFQTGKLCPVDWHHGEKTIN